MISSEVEKLRSDLLDDMNHVFWREAKAQVLKKINARIDSFLELHFGVKK